MLLSIVIPCYNRHEMLIDCIRSVGSLGRERVEIVVVDDGSDPPLSTCIGQHLAIQDRLCRQNNLGRASALREGILSAQGKFILLMDSDDEFVDGAVTRILSDLAMLPHSNVGLVYECVNFQSGELIARLPSGVSASLLALRADYKVRGDLKEVVRRSIVVAELYPEVTGERRMPTSYIWAGVSNHGPVEVKSCPVVRHRYLPGGMTSSIRKLKRESPNGLAMTYLRVATANDSAYRSRIFRARYAVGALSVRGSSVGFAGRTRLRRSLGGLWFLLVSLFLALYLPLRSIQWLLRRELRSARQ